MANAIRRKTKSQLSVPQGGKVKGTKAFREWFGKGQLKFSNGDPYVLYHGTRADFTVFDSKKNFAQNEITPDWLYFTTDPQLAQEMAMEQVDDTTESKIFNAEQKFNETSLEQKNQIAMEYIKDMIDTGNLPSGSTSFYIKKLYRNKMDTSESTYYVEEDVADNMREAAFFTKELGRQREDFRQLNSVRVMPVFLNAKNIFDPSNKSHVNKLMSLLKEDKDWYDYDYSAEMVSTGNYQILENRPVAKALKKLKFDGAFLKRKDHFSRTLQIKLGCLQ